MTVSKYQRVWEYSGAYTDSDYAWDDGHAWDRLACIAVEYARGDISWAWARRMCDENREDVRRSAAAARAAMTDGE